MKNFLLFLCLLCIVVPQKYIKAEWIFQEFDTAKYSSVEYFSPYKATFSKSNTKIAGYYENAIIEYDIDDLSKSKKLELMINPKNNRQYDIKKIEYNESKESYQILTQNGLFFLDKNNNIRFESINDQYLDKVKTPANYKQYLREYKDAFIKGDTTFILATGFNFYKTELIQGLPVYFNDSSRIEIWSNVNGKFSLLELDYQEAGMIPYTLKFTKNKNAFLVNSSVLNSNLRPLFEIENNKIKKYDQSDEISKCMNRNCAFSFVENDTIYACYGAANDSLTNKRIPTRLIIYENGNIRDVIILGINDFNQFSQISITKYKEYRILNWGGYFMIGKDNYFEKLKLPSKYSYISDLALTNDKGIFIFTKEPFGILYNHDLDDVISKSTIDEEINSQEYFKIVNNSIEFLQSADQFSVFDLNGNQVLSSDKVESTILLSNLSNGTYFISAQFGNKFISDKFLINN